MMVRHLSRWYTKGQSYSILVFETLGRSQLTVNPSYHSFTLEECDAIDVENDLLEAKGDSDG
jgi:hypothetical protein